MNTEYPSDPSATIECLRLAHIEEHGEEPCRYEVPLDLWRALVPEDSGRCLNVPGLGALVWRDPGRSEAAAVLHEWVWSDDEWDFTPSCRRCGSERDINVGKPR